MYFLNGFCKRSLKAPTFWEMSQFAWKAVNENTIQENGAQFVASSQMDPSWQNKNLTSCNMWLE